ncbi:hypothetical protein ACWTU6_19810 [Mesorhizobium sp. BHbsci]
MRALIERLPIVLLSSVYYVVATREGDQISVLFDASSAWTALLATALAMASATGMLPLTQRGNAIWRLLDTVLFALPALLLIVAFRHYDRAAVYIAAAGAILTLMLCFWLQRGPEPTWRLAVAVLSLAMILWLCLYLATRMYPIAFPRAFGSIGLTLAFLALTAVCLQLMVRYPALGIPAAVLLGYLFLFIERPHEIGQVELTKANAVGGEWRQSVSLQESFNTWLAGRNDLQAYGDADIPYPVFLVTAEGGGGYAAAHADLFLSKMQKRCPNFAQHVFALVGVSGGSVGNTMFWAGLQDDINLAEPMGCKDHNEEDPKSIDRLSADHLSPVLAALFFKDFPNKFWPVFGDGDRSDALSESILNSIHLPRDKSNPLYFEHYWSKGAEDQLVLNDRPALVDVATNLMSGKRYVFAPFVFSFPKQRFEEGLLDLNWQGDDEAGIRSSDIHLMDAAIASASFPYVTPSRVLHGMFGQSIALVDGGYIDNSGGETARDILAELQDPNVDFDGSTLLGLQPPRSYQPPTVASDCHHSPQYVPVADPRSPPDTRVETCGVKFSVYVISIRAEVPYERGVGAQNFFLDPITSLLKARSRRGETARYALLSQLCGSYNCPPG